MPFRITTALIAGLFCAILGTWAFARNPRGNANRNFALFNLTLAIWNFAELSVYIEDHHLALALYRLCYVVGSFIAFSFLKFLFSIMKRGISWPYRFINWSTLLFALLSTTSLIIGDIQYSYRQSSPVVEVEGSIYNLFILSFISTLAYSLYELIVGYRRSSGVIKNQLQYVALAICLSIVGIIIFIANQLNEHILPVHYLIEMGMSSIFAYIILRYRLMDLRILLKDTSRYLFSSGVIGIGFAVVTFLVTNDLRLSAVVFLTGLMVPLMQNKLSRWLAEVRSRSGLVDSKRSQNIRTLSDRIKEAGYKISDLAETVMEIVIDELPTNKCAIFVIDSDRGAFEVESQVGLVNRFAQPISFSDPLVKYLNQHQEILVKSEAERFMGKQEFELISVTFSLLESEVCVPLMVLDRLAGFICLGEKSDKRPYFVNEINRLVVISTEASTALRYVLAVSKAASETKRWAHSLNQSLKPLSQAFEVLKEDDPLVSTDPDRAEIYNRIKRPLKRLAEFLFYLTHQSRIVDESLRNRYELTPVNISEVIAKGVSTQKMSAVKKEVQVAVNLNELDLNIPGHQRDLISVFEALATNALRYVPQGGKIKIAGIKNGDFYIINFENDGPVIPAEHLEDIFIEGFQVKDGREGTGGLGLANAKRIVEMHGGKIWAENTGNETGVRFIIELPLRRAAA